MPTAVFPGTFDPFTLGHLDLVKRAQTLFSRVIILVLDNPSKSPLLSIEKRMQAILSTLDKGVEVQAFSGGLLAEFVKQHHIEVIVRGLRHATDWDYEWPMAHMNRQLAPHCQTVFLTPDIQHTHISSTLARQVLQAKGDASTFLPEAVLRAYR